MISDLNVLFCQINQSTKNGDNSTLLIKLIQLQNQLILIIEIGMTSQNQTQSERFLSKELQTLFPKVFYITESQDSTLSTKYFQQIQDRFSLNSLSNTIIPEKSIHAISKSLKSIIKQKYIFLNSYGCSIVLEKLQNFRPTVLKLVFPIQWGFTSSIKKNQVKYVASDPQSETVKQIGSITSNFNSLQSQVNQFQQIINSQISEQLALKVQNVNDRKNHHTPSWILQVAKSSLKTYNEATTPPKANQNKSQKKTQIMSKGGTLDVGIHTGITKPNTSFQIIKALYSFIVEDSKLVQLMIVDYKLAKVAKQLFAMNIFSSTLDKQYRYIFKELISKIKDLTNNQIQYLEDKAHQIITRYYEHLNSSFKKWQGDCIIKQQLCQSVNQQNASFCYFDKIASYDSDQNKVLNMKHSLGFSETLKIKPDFTTLLNNKYQQNIWFLMTEQIFFNIAITQLKIGFVPIEIKLSQIQCTKDDFSIMHKVINKYELILNKNVDKYGLMLKNQAYGHLYLIKFIAAAISFQVVKKNREKSFSNLQKYAVSMQIDELYCLFHSLSFEATSALQAMLEYSKRNREKQYIFCLQQSKQSFYKYAINVGNEDNLIKKWVVQKQSLVKQAISKLQNQFNKFNVKYSEAKKQVATYLGKQCSCTTTEHVNRKGKVIYKTISCFRCSMLKNCRSMVNFYEEQQFSYIICPFADNQSFFYGFINNIPNDILGMMKMIYESQIQKIQKMGDSQIPANFIKIGYAPLQPFSPSVKQKKSKFYLNYLKESSSFVLYPSRQILNYYDNKLNKHPISEQLLQMGQLPQQCNKYKFMVDTPKLYMLNRQHQIYSNLFYKSQQESIQEFVAFASIRVSQQTQLQILTQKIKNRQIYIKTVFDNQKMNTLREKQIYAKMLILLGAAADVNAFTFYNKSNLNLDRSNFIQECIQQLLQQYGDKWSHDDLYFMHIVGIIMSLFSKKINKTDLVIKIVARAYNEFYNFANKTNDRNNQFKSQLAYYIHAMFSFYSQEITHNNDRQSIHIWIKLQVQFRINKVFSDQSIIDYRFRQTIKIFQHFKVRAIFNNIDNVRQYFAKHPQQLTQIIMIIDKGAHPKLKWRQNPKQGRYVFTGQFQNLVYDLNIFTGVLLKDGCEITGLPDSIKKNNKFVEIFGVNRDFQVYKSKDGSLRTSSDFLDYFQNEAGSKIFFEFKLFQNDLVIRMIFKKQHTQLKYVLITENILIQSNFDVPALYRKQYFAWYCKQENAIVFRKKTLDQMSKIGLVLLVKKRTSFIDVIEGRVIDNKFNKQSQFQLQKPQNSDHFQHLKLFCKIKQKQSNKQHFNNLAFKILSSIEYSSYIIQVDSPILVDGMWKRITKFWLHRYNLKFTFNPKDGLISDNYQGYGISQNYNHHFLLPWGTFQNVNCLILQKRQKDLRFARSHKYMILIPDTAIIACKKINIIPHGENRSMRMFSYEIHDHFKDLRGKKRLQQLHMATLIASCYLPKIKELEMTNVEYSLLILRSCINITPLSAEQLKKIQNLLKNSIQKNQMILIIQSKVIYDASKLLKYILPLSNGKIVNSQQQTTLFEQYSAFITECKGQYKNSLMNQQVSIRQQLNQLELQILNYPNNMIAQAEKRKNTSKWAINNPITLQKQAFSDKDLLSLKQLSQQNQIFKQSILNEAVQLNKHDQKLQQSDMKMNMESDDQMIKQQQNQIQSSLNSYKILQQKYEIIQLLPSTKQKYIEKYKKCIIILETIYNQILTKINDFQIINSQHFDYLTGRYSFITERDFTDIICNQQKIKTFYPNITDKCAENLRNLMVGWVTIKTEIGSLERIIFILQDQQNQDKIGLLRQIESPRNQIAKIKPWLCFELQMKTQIWLSQFETFKLLEQSNSGSVTQLNMGEGKTQIIIPMIVLYELYIKCKRMPRVNILSPLYQQAQQNYFKFLSVTGFKINLVPLYFNREVQIYDSNIKKMQYAAYLFRHNSLILVDRDSSLSMILKIRQHYGLKDRQSASQDQIQLTDKQLSEKDRLMFRDTQLIDIFDQVDALMTAKKSFVYAVGSSTPLPNSRIRFQYAQIFIQILLKQMIAKLIGQNIAIIQESLESAEKAIKTGKYPRGLRLTQNLDHERMLKFRRQITQHFLTKYLPSEFQFYKHLKQQQKDSLLQYIIDSSLSLQQTIMKVPSIPQKVYYQIFAARGIVAYGILQHCLVLRCGVDYGAPGKQNLKRVGVPYEAADVPSKRSEYSHPQVAIILSYFSYFNKGLSINQFQQTLKCLLKQTHSSQYDNYNKWLSCIEDQSFRPEAAKQVKQINQQSNLQKEQLFKCFRYCRSTIVFWLIHCVFSNDLAQYNKSITASSWDIADSKYSLGFSGTKDTHWILPNYIKLLQSKNHQINGTDGKMIQQMLDYTLEVNIIQQNSDSLWKRFCESSLKLKVGCIIDAGAILAGKKLQNDIIPWFINNQSFKSLGYKGISYCNQSGIWKVYDTQSHTIIPRDTSIPQHQTFVIFDQARTRGADIKMKTDTKAVLSLGPNMMKDKLMQAVGRLRKFGRNQKIYILSTRQNYSKINHFNHQETIREKTKTIIEWVCLNSIKDNKKMLFPNAKLAWIHFQNTNSQKGLTIQQFNPTLDNMYRQKIKHQTVFNLNEEIAIKHKYQIKQSNITGDLRSAIRIYGINYHVRCQDLEDVCEREVQMVEENQKQRQKQLTLLTPIEENDMIQIYQGTLSTVDLQLNNGLLFSRNFKLCTHYNALKGYQQYKQENNELCQINFVIINTYHSSITVITQKQANRQILKGMKSYGPYSVRRAIEGIFIVRFGDLSNKLPFISQFRLKKLLTDAQFFNGKQIFENKQFLLETIKFNIKQLQTKNTEDLVCHFIKRRRTVQNKFYCSDLQKIYKQIISSQ